MIKIWDGLSPFVKIMTVVGGVLFLYGSIAKSFGIFFFWESYYIGYVFLVISLGAVLFVELLILVKLFKVDNRDGWRTAIHILITSLVVFVSVTFYFSDSLEEVKTELKTNEELIELVGKVEGFGWFTSGSTSSVTDSNGTVQTGNYNIIVKGNKAYAEVLVAFQKRNENPWEIKIIKASR